MILTLSITGNIVLAFLLYLKWRAYISMSEYAQMQRVRAENLANSAGELRLKIASLSNPLRPVAGKVAVKTEVKTEVVEPSFEQMQAEAIEEQEKYYAPVPRS